MQDISFFLKAFIALLVLVNPLEGMPIFLSGTDGVDPLLRRKIARRTPIAVIIILIMSLFLGNALLKLFGISSGAFETGGGVILFLIAVKMVLGPEGNTLGGMGGRQITAEFAVVPLAIPVLAGPGAINGAVLYGLQAHTVLNMIVLAFVIMLVGLVVYITLKASAKIARYLKSTGISITTRIMGLIIAAIAVEMISNGISSMFHLKTY